MEISSIISPLKYVALFLVLILAQILICNNILLFGVAIPFVYIYFILVLPLNTNLNLLMILAFLMGLLIDLFSDTLGLNCLACLLLSVLKKPVFYAYMPHEDKFLSAIPSISTMGWFNYLKYILTLIAIFTIVIFGVEFFSFASFGRIMAMTASSLLFSLLVMLAVDALFNRGMDQ